MSGAAAAVAAAAVAATVQAGKGFLQQHQHATCSSTCPCVRFADGLLEFVHVLVQDSLQPFQLALPVHLAPVAQEAEQAAEQSALAQLLPQLAAQLLTDHPQVISPNTTTALRNTKSLFYE
jgi:hypothetical protein